MEKCSDKLKLSKKLRQRRHICELWSKLKTIRDDANTSFIYSRWCDQVMELLGWLQEDD